MIGPMPYRPRLAAAIWAAVVVIAAQLFAGSALAHGGHAHAPATAAQASTAQPANDARSSGAQVARSKQADPSLSPRADADSPAPAESDGCSRGCCGSAGGGSGAVLPSAWNPIPDGPVRQPTLSLAFAPQAGTDPEALTRPPKALA